MNAMSRLMRLKGLGLCASILCLLICGACNRTQLWDWATGEHDISSDVRMLETADRMVVTRRRGGDAVKETAGRDEVVAVLDLIHRYPRGWKVVSGAFGDYEIDLYRGSEPVGRVGLATGSEEFPGMDFVHVSGAVRHVSKEDVSALATMLGLEWPIR